MSSRLIVQALSGVCLLWKLTVIGNEMVQETGAGQASDASIVQVPQQPKSRLAGVPDLCRLQSDGPVNFIENGFTLFFQQIHPGPNQTAFQFEGCTVACVLSGDSQHGIRCLVMVCG